MGSCNLDPELGRRLVDPVDRQPLRLADEATLRRVRRRLEEGDASWWERLPRVEGALVTADGAWAYPVTGGLPVLLPEARLALPGDGRGEEG